MKFLKRFPLARTLRYSGRLVCLGCLVGFGVIVAESVSAFSRPTTLPIAAEPEIGPALLPEAGFWSFTGTQLVMKRAHPSATEVEARFATIQGEQAVNAAQQDASELVAIAEANNARQVQTEATNVWMADGADLRLRLVTSRAEPPMLVAAVVATRTGSDWETIELRPKHDGETSEHLLPAGSASQSVCSRRTDSGELVMELITTSCPATNLLSRWNDDGWQIRHTPWGSPDSFSYLCVRNEEVIYAWSAETTGQRTLMLTRTTASTTGSAR